MYESLSSCYSKLTKYVAGVDKPPCPLFLCHLQGVNNIFSVAQRVAKQFVWPTFPQGREKLSFAGFLLEALTNHIHHALCIHVTYLSNVSLWWAGSVIRFGEEQNRTRKILSSVKLCQAKQITKNPRSEEHCSENKNWLWYKIEVKKRETQVTQYKT